ncbi:rac GTPase-activating protein 1-like isoform X2 [Strongylocentrotus purpuratus]|uniref:Rac GTPase-activating protein 1 n=1 Tax=Strongylocentrotus purpuratus TaxID=7668 RepID=A0A7M7P9Y6_STRPU|nr:rac GTPase-activating protein 1-like isoform X2 [Strongylocentrotus purpuratus]|eukprot:XP_011661278.1 PREDICTED: rac GTPase-activating protein 1 isoform X3 [Strongylocentrotus purpuratus]
MTSLVRKPKSLVATFDEIVHYSSILSKGCEEEFMVFAKHQEQCRQRWLAVEQDRMGGKEQGMKLGAERDALQTKLKHARNQLESEMSRRRKAESSQEELERQIALIRELLTNDNNKMNTLTEKERESILFLSHNAGTPQPGQGSPNKRLSCINEKSADLLSNSDLDLDHTEEELDVSVLRDGKKWHRKKRKPSAPPLEEEDETPPRKNKRLSHDTSIVTTVTVPHDHGPIIATTNVEKNGRYRRSMSQPALPIKEEQFLWMSPIQLRTPGNKRARIHTFCTKTVIKPESCDPCGKRIKFGKYALKCKDCRLVCHPDCKDSASLPCVPTAGTPNKTRTASALDEFTPENPPYVPSLVMHCINEIEMRGLTEEGIYRISGSEREVKELRERLILKNDPHLEKVRDIHCVCGALKDFFRNLPEPLVTFELHLAFMKAAELYDIDDSTTAMYQAVSELPHANRDTMAYLITHLQRVSESPECKMPVSNLAKVFGPTIIGYGCSEPDPMQMLNDTKTQPRVVERLMALPSDFWKAFINFEAEQENSTIYANRHRTPGTPGQPSHMSMLGPVRTPGKTPAKTPSNSSLGKAKTFLGKSSLTPSMKKTTEKKSSSISSRFGSKSDRSSKKGTNFFASPTLR